MLAAPLKMPQLPLVRVYLENGLSSFSLARSFRQSLFCLSSYLVILLSFVQDVGHVQNVQPCSADVSPCSSSGYSSRHSFHIFPRALEGPSRLCSPKGPTILRRVLQVRARI